MYTIDSFSTVAWSPAPERLLAVGTVAGALDATFSSSTSLQLFRIDSSGEAKATTKPNELSEIFTGSSEIEFAPTATEYMPTSICSVNTSARFTRLAWTTGRTMGIIAGGLETGELVLYDPKLLVDGEEAKFFSDTGATEPIYGLEFNPLQRNLLASGAGNSDIKIWDLENLKPYAPGSKSTRMDKITDLAWNCQVAHILATCAASGYAVVWDLKNRREVVNLGGREKRGFSAIVWNPQVPTKLVTATDDDAEPVVMCWDLRNAHAPEKVLRGHEKGVLGLAWNNMDPRFMLSCSKDGRTVCWDMKSGEQIGKSEARSNWTFDVQFSRTNPSMFSVAGFDGRVEVSLLERMHLKVAPKWIARPAGAVFGHGGRLLVFRDKVVALSTVATDRQQIETMKELESILESKEFSSYCKKRMESEDKLLWSVLETFCHSEYKQLLVEILKTIETTKQPPTEQQEECGDLDEDEIKKLLVDADYKMAVKSYLQAGKRSEALEVALCSKDDELIEETRKECARGQNVEMIRRVVNGEVESVAKELEWSQALILLLNFGGDVSTVIESWTGAALQIGKMVAGILPDSLEMALIYSQLRNVLLDDDSLAIHVQQLIDLGLVKFATKLSSINAPKAASRKTSTASTGFNNTYGSGGGFAANQGYRQNAMPSSYAAPQIPQANYNAQIPQAAYNTPMSPAAYGASTIPHNIPPVAYNKQVSTDSSLPASKRSDLPGWNDIPDDLVPTRKPEPPRMVNQITTPFAYSGYTQQNTGYSGQQPGYSGQQPGYPAQQPGYPAQQPGYPAQQGGFKQSIAPPPPPTVGFQKPAVHQPPPSAGYQPALQQQHGMHPGAQQQQGMHPGAQQQHGMHPGAQQQHGMHPGAQQQQGMHPGAQQQHGMHPGAQQQHGMHPGAQQQQGMHPGAQQQQGMQQGGFQPGHPGQAGYPRTVPSSQSAQHAPPPTPPKPAVPARHRIV